MKPRWCRIASVSLAFVLMISFAGRGLLASESSGWSFRAWQTDEGLPDNSVTGVAQTSDGYLWVATYGGLMRFNGANFQEVNLPNGLKKSVRTMLQDHRGRLWLGTDPDGVACLDSNESRVYSSGDGLPAERAAVIVEDHQGAIWIAYQSMLCRIKDEKVTRFTATNGWPAGDNAWLTTDAVGRLWYSKGGQVGVFHDGKLLQKMTFPEAGVRIYGAALSGLWICAGSHLLKYEENHEPEDLVRLPANSEPQALFEDHTGVLWIGTATYGVFRFVNSVLEKIPTSHQSVYSLSEDREGDIWIGTRGGGLNLVRPSAVAVLGQESGLPFESIASVCEDSMGCRWVVSQSGALARNCSGQWEELGANAGWVGGFANCVATDRSGGVWVGTRNRTLHCLREGVWRVWQRQDGLRGGAVHLVFPSSNDDVWVVTGTPSVLQRFRAGKISPSFELPGENRTIRAMSETPDGQLWVATSEGQILRVEDSALVVEPAAMEMSGVPIRALETTSDGSLWIGYVGGGIGRLKDGKFARITTANGLADDFASQLLADGQGGMWVVGNRGVFRVQLDDLIAVAESRAKRLRCLVFGRNEGLPIFQPNTANFPNFCKGGDGRLWFALRSGLLTVQPGSVRDNPVPPPVLLERVSVDEQPVALYGSFLTHQSVSDKGWTDLRPTNVVLRVPPGHRRIEFDFTALSFASPENVQFRYRLDNFDSQWNVADSKQRSVKYPHLPAGNYQFRVIACNNAGVWNEAGAAITLVATPYFWQTPWFRGLVLIVFTVSVVVVVRYVSFRRLRLRMYKLEQQAALARERARIARDMHDEVGAKLTRLSLLSEMAGGHPEISAVAQSDVREISETARETIRSFEEIVWAVNPRNDTLADLVHYLCRYVEDYFEGSSIKCAFELPQEIPPFVISTEVRHEVFLAAKEALNNVLKHAKAKRVRLLLASSTADFTITIVDDGCGFDAAAPPKRMGGGNGLGNMQERLRSIGGRFECFSEVGLGTQIVFKASCSLKK